jgi:hypothetical protein
VGGLRGHTLVGIVEDAVVEIGHCHVESGQVEAIGEDNCNRTGGGRGLRFEVWGVE